MSDQKNTNGTEHTDDTPESQPPGTTEELREAFPQLVDQIEEAARAEGVVSERERIQAIEELEAPGHEDFVAERKFDPEATADSVSREVLERQKQGRQDRLNARREDEEQMDAPGPSPNADIDGGEEGEKAAAFILTAGKQRRESA